MVLCVVHPAAVIKIHLKQYTSPKIKGILQNTCIDNIILTTSDQEELIKNPSLKLIYNQAKMNVRQFATSSKCAHRNMPKEDRDDSIEISILLLYWTPNPDSITIKYKSWEGQMGNKKNILAYIASQIDPLKLIIPTILLLN